MTFAKLASRLVESYAMDALVSPDGEREQGEPPKAEQAERWLSGLPALEESCFESVGAGEDYRYEGASAIGSALVFEDTALHSSFFASREDDPRHRRGERLSSLSRRRRLWRDRSGGQGEDPAPPASGEED